MMMLTRGYKQGKAVRFYDVSAIDGSCAREMVSKDEVVKMCSDGEISNAKIQWWEGKAIVRCDNKQLPLVKINENNEVIGVATQSVRSSRSESKPATKVEPEPPSVADKAEVVGKVSDKKPRKNTSFNGYGYNYKNVIEQRELSKTVNLTGLKTVGDLFDYIARDLGARNTEEYKAQFAKKVNTGKLLSEIGGSQLKAIEYSAATYLMNMVYEEISEVYKKYKI